MIAAKEISRIELGFELHQPIIIRTIGLAHAMALTFVKRIYVHLTSIKWLHGIHPRRGAIVASACSIGPA